jgi:hypothetical protein
MKKSCVVILAAITATCAVSTSRANVIADWTFETSQPSGTGPTSVGPFSAETGTGTAYAVNLNAISTPAGNGSSHSFSANGWNGASAGYYQFDVSAAGYSGLDVTFDQTSSSTGPANFIFQYSTDGLNFTSFTSYSPAVNGTPNSPWNGTTSSSVYSFNFDLSSVSALDNASTVDFRLLETGTVAENGSAVASTGTDRVDNFVVNGSVSPVPEPATLALSGLGGLAGMFLVRRKR